LHPPLEQHLLQVLPAGPTTMISDCTDNRQNSLLSFFSGAVIGVFGGLIGLGGAEFRLPLVLTVFGYATLPAVVVNLALILVTVVFSFIFRLKTIGLDVIASNLSVVVNILPARSSAPTLAPALPRISARAHCDTWSWSYS
jgi:hypothetical protein